MKPTTEWSLAILAKAGFFSLVWSRWMITTCPALIQKFSANFWLWNSVAYQITKTKKQKKTPAAASKGSKDNFLIFIGIVFQYKFQFLVWLFYSHSFPSFLFFPQCIKCICFIYTKLSGKISCQEYESQFIVHFHSSSQIPSLFSPPSIYKDAQSLPFKNWMYTMK